MSDVPPLPRATTFLGHPEGPETFYPVVFVAGPRPIPLRVQTGRGRTFDMETKTLTLKGVVITRPLAEVFVNLWDKGVEWSHDTFDPPVKFGMTVKKNAVTYPTLSPTVEPALRLLNLFGVRAVLAEECDGTT
jgi:hypothetical protein